MLDLFKQQNFFFMTRQNGELVRKIIMVQKNYDGAKNKQYDLYWCTMTLITNGCICFI